MSARAESFGSNGQVVPLRASRRVDAAVEPVRTAVVGYGYWGPNLVGTSRSARSSIWSASASST